MMRLLKNYVTYSQPKQELGLVEQPWEELVKEFVPTEFEGTFGQPSLRIC